MSSLITEKAPEFSASAVTADGRIESDFNLCSLRGKYVVLFFYPLDFTFVCPTEILAFNEHLKDFQSREAEVIGVSVDSAFSHLAWRRTSLEKGGIGSIGYRLVSDLDKRISRQYGVLLNDEVALRGLFLIDREGFVRHSLINDLPLGRSVAEALRTLDALRYHEQRGQVCPANWQHGEDGMSESHLKLIACLG